MGRICSLEGRRVDQGLRSQPAKYLNTVQYECGPIEMLLAGGRVWVTMDLGLSLLCTSVTEQYAGGQVCC